MIGRSTAAGQVQLLPPMDTRFATGDQAIAVAADDASIAFTGVEPIAAPARPEPNGEVPQAEHILVVGWSPTGELSLRELDRFLPSGSRIEIRVDEALVDPDTVPVPILRNTKVTFVGEADQPDLVDRVAEAKFDEVLVLGYREGVSESDADARTLLTLLTLDRARTANATSVPRVIAQLLDAKHLALARIAGADDFIVSDSLASRMLGQLSSRPQLGAVFDDLFDPEGASLAVEPASSYLPPGSHRFAAIVASARARGQIAIGYRQADGRVRLNLPKSETVSLSGVDHIVVLKSQSVSTTSVGRAQPSPIVATVNSDNGDGSLIAWLRSAIGARLPW